MKHPVLTVTNGSKQFKSKTKAQQKLIAEALEFLDLCGIPLEKESPRGMEMIALAFLAAADVNPVSGWGNLKTLLAGRSMKTRDVIAYINSHYRESISSGSYDDIRRRYLLWPVMAGIVVNTAPDSARNAPNRGYAVADGFGTLACRIGQPGWQTVVKTFMADQPKLSTTLSQPRAIPAMSVAMSDGSTLDLTAGAHNQLQKAIIEEFLPRYGYDAQVLYVGDAANKSLYVDYISLKAVQMFRLDHGELPDVVAISNQKGWLYLIEAFHSTGPMNPERVHILKSLTKDCIAPIVYVTAFEDRAAFRANSHDIAWETEVWIASEPDHLIHYNGDKFMGPHLTTTQV